MVLSELKEMLQGETLLLGLIVLHEVLVVI